MRDLTQLDEFRFEMPGYGPGNEQNGWFCIPSPVDGGDLRCCAAVGAGWDHVSISRGDRIPNWDEMDFLARKFFRDHETAMQLHVPESDHIDRHKFCLHLWRPCRGKPIPRPPAEFV